MATIVKAVITTDLDAEFDQGVLTANKIRLKVGAGLSRNVSNQIVADVQGAANGLTLTTNNVELGGTLTKNTTVARSTFSLAVTSATSGMKIDGTASYMEFVNGSDVGRAYIDNGSALVSYYDNALAKTAKIQVNAGYAARIDADDITLTDYLSTRNDLATEAAANLLYTTTTGVLMSTPIRYARRLATQTVTTTASITIGTNDLVLASAAANYTITLNHPTNALGLNFIVIKRTDASAGFTITLSPASGTIDGQTAAVLNVIGSVGAVLRIYSDGTNFYTI